MQSEPNQTETAKREENNKNGQKWKEKDIHRQGGTEEDPWGVNCKGRDTRQKIDHKQTLRPVN